MTQPDMNFYELIRLRECWNYLVCGEYEPYGLNLYNRAMMAEYDNTIQIKKLIGTGKIL